MSYGLPTNGYRAWHDWTDRGKAGSAKAKVRVWVGCGATQEESVLW